MDKQIAKITKAALIVGTLDILAAFIYFFIKTGNTNVFIILKYVASGILSKEVSSGGIGLIAGLVIHYTIAFSFTCFFFLLYSRIKPLSRNPILIGILYGIFIWTVMNLVVVPLSRIGASPFYLTGALINAAILICCIGIPLSFMANRMGNSPQKDQRNYVSQDSIPQ